MSQYTEKAKELYASGCNCAQAAFVPFCEKAGMNEEQAMLIASSFGGGIGGMKEMCGALTGSFMAAGLFWGYGRDCTPEIKGQHSERIQALAAAFREEFDCTNCRDLLERNEREEAPPAGEKPCTKYVTSAVQNLEKTL